MLAPIETAINFPTKRILSIDGGGIKGTFPAAFLANLEEDLDEPIGQYFDLIAGTSTGGILAIGLALGIPAQDLLRLYVDKGPEIFGQAGHPNKLTAWLVGKWATARQFVRSKHPTDALEKALRSVLQNKKLGEAKTRLVIPAWDADANDVYIYKTAHHKRLTSDYKQTAVDVALATSAAPTFFKRHRTANQVGLIDGGVWANNPTGLAAVEAITLLGWPAAQLRILSLGCVDEVYTLPESLSLLNFVFSWKLRAISLFMDGQSKGALGVAKLITDHPHSGEAVFRYVPQMPAGLLALDDTSKVQKLTGLGASIARQAAPKLKPIFFEKPAEKFLPVHGQEFQT